MILSFYEVVDEFISTIIPLYETCASNTTYIILLVEVYMKHDDLFLADAHNIVLRLVGWLERVL